MQGDGQRAAVVGGSLGGLTVANLLRDSGWDVSVHERSAVPLDGRGAGIVVHDATVRYLLERTGTPIESISCPSSFVRHLSPDGSTLHEQPSTYRFTSWNSLYQALLSTIGDDYRLDHAVTGVDQANAVTTVHLASGEHIEAELVVAADGFDSTVRRHLFPAPNTTYSGYVGWRGLVSERDVSRETFELLADAITYCVIADSHIVAYPIPTNDGSVEIGDRVINYVWYRNVAEGPDFDELMTDVDGNRRSVSLPPGTVRQEFTDELRDAASALAPQLTEVIERTTEPFLQAVVDIESTQLVAGHVALLGDGAFAARPHAAAGTAKAAEDGWRLVEELDRHNTITDALAAWEPTQLELGRQLVARARAIGERSQVTNTWVPGDPALAFGLYGPGR